MSPCWMSCQPLGKRLNNKSWTVHPNIAFRTEGHRKIQVRDLHLVQMMSQCRATSGKSRHRSLCVAIPNVAGDKSRATRRLSRLTEHKQRNTCVANDVVVAVACRVSRVARNWTRLNLFAFTQEYILSISTFISLTISFKFLPVQKRLVSSAKRIGKKNLETEGKSFL